MSIFLCIIGIMLIMSFPAFVFMDHWYTKKAIIQYQKLPPGIQELVGIYPAFHLRIFTTLGYRPSKEVLGLLYNEYLYMDGKTVIPIYKRVPFEFQD